ncbi:MAG TPA: acyl-CoA desaturase [Terriglobia bacterium]|jgi:stearoyl-CoA desaturase (delta-9 desaturase)
MAILIFFVAHWFLSLFSQTFFLHRYGAHRMFTLSPRAERFFYLLTAATQGPSFLVPKAYAVLHRMHHAFSDTEQDPHSPRFFRDPVRMMKHTETIYRGILRKPATAAPEFAAEAPEWETVDKIAGSWYIRVAWGVMYSLFYLRFASSPWLFLLLPFHFQMGVFHGAIVNWCGHRYGYRNYPAHDESRNALPIDFLMMGELYQNNHHRHPKAANFAVRWFELDPAYPIIWLLKQMRIVRYGIGA